MTRPFIKKCGVTPRETTSTIILLKRFDQFLSGILEGVGVLKHFYGTILTIFLFLKFGMYESWKNLDTFEKHT